MRVERYSAIEMMGVPIDGKQDDELIYSARGLLRLMSRYGIEGTEIPDDLIDITPPYWEKNKFKYMLSRVRPDGPAVVELLPVHSDSQTDLVVAGSTDYVVTTPYHLRRIEIPTDQDAFPLIGPSPRFAGKLCVHEVVSLVEP